MDDGDLLGRAILAECVPVARKLATRKHREAEYYGEVAKSLVDGLQLAYDVGTTAFHSDRQAGQQRAVDALRAIVDARVTVGLKPLADLEWISELVHSVLDIEVSAG